MAQEQARFRDEEVQRPQVVAPAPDRPVQGVEGGRDGAAAGPPAASLVPPGFGSSARSRGRRSGGGGGGGGGGGPRGPRPGRGPAAPGMGGGGRGPPPGRGGGGGPPAGPPGGPPPHGGKAESKLRQEALREERRAALFKRQVAAMEVSPTMLSLPDAELRARVLRGGPDVAPPSSFEELPAVQHCYWAELLLPDQARLQAPSVFAPGVDHATPMAEAMRLHQQAPSSGPHSSQSVLLQGSLGDFAVSKEMADLIDNV